MRTFHFTNLTDAAHFCAVEGIPAHLVQVKARNPNGIATRCELTVPAELF